MDTTTTGPHTLVHMPRLGEDGQQVDTRDCFWYEYHGMPEELALYKFIHEEDAESGEQYARTVFERFNVSTGRYEQAGHIEWVPGHSTVTFGIHDPVSMRELRKAKKKESTSRYWSWKNHNYKWKKDEAENLTCYQVPLIGANKLLATYTKTTRTLVVEARGEEVIDQIVVLCFIHKVCVS
ncbi:hypothetical protein BKA62DRAFT_238043 [Auriculariales sp. MPI-PUGE-AT-0066]|nr:hypothetical protein BKA62DRAFT_238043 [Auriculariales sp. MPI-PUGE-AT-0066]